MNNLDIEMYNLEDDTLLVNYDAVAGVNDENGIEDARVIEMETSGQSHDTITSTQSAPGAVNTDKPLQQPSLPTVEELSEDPLPTPQHISSDPQKMLEEFLSATDTPAQGDNCKIKFNASSSSLPAGGVQKSKVTRSKLTTPKPLLHTATSPTLLNPFENGIGINNKPSNVPANTTAERRENTLTRRRTQQEFSCEPVTRRPRDLHLQRRSSRYQSKFLDDNEDHVIWKPERSPHNVTAASEPINKKPSTSSMTPATDYGVTKSKSWDHPDGNNISPISDASPTTAVSDFRLRQQQLLERVNVAREVAKDQNNKLYLPEVSDNDKRLSLKLASRYVSYRISKKPRGMVDVVLEAMGKRDSDSPVGLDKPLTPKEKWQKATVLLSASQAHTPKMQRTSVTSLVSNHSELQPVKIHRIGQYLKKRHPPISDMKQSWSEQHLSEIGTELPPTTKASRPPLKTRATCVTITTGNLDEVDGESEDKKQQEIVDPVSPVVDLVNDNNSNSNNDNNNDSSTLINDKPQGCGWSGSTHSYDNQAYMHSSSSVDSVSSFTKIDHSDTVPAIKLTKTKSSSTKDLSSAIQEGLSHVQLRQSQSYGTLLQPVSLEKAVHVPADYQFQSKTGVSLVRVQPKSTVSSTLSLDSGKSPELQSKKMPMSSKMELESVSPQNSGVHLNSQSISASSIVPHMMSHDQDDKGASSHMLLSASQDESCVSSSSLYAGRQVHRHGDKDPTSTNVL